MNIVLIDLPDHWNQLLPFTYTRPISEIRVGVLKIADKWRNRINRDVSYSTEEYLSHKFPELGGDDILYINSTILPDDAILRRLLTLKSGDVLYGGEDFIAARSDKPLSEAIKRQNFEGFTKKEYSAKYSHLTYPSDIFRLNGEEIRADFDLITLGWESEEITDPHTMVYDVNRIFVEEGAQIRASVIDATTGPVYIGKDATVEPGSVIRGPFALLPNATINIGTKVRGDTTVGPYCKVGGEISNTVFFGYANKGHDGFIGNSVVGEWCNFGAGTNVSNLKNNYTQVKVWDYPKKGFRKTDLTFHGLLMADHAKCGINSMFNTATTVGVGANIFGAGYPRTFIPSFSWGGASGYSTFNLEKFYEMTELVMQRRKRSLNTVDMDILKHIFESTENYRTWDKK